MHYHDVVHSFTVFLKRFSYIIEIFSLSHCFIFINAWIQLTLKATSNGFTHSIRSFVYYDYYHNVVARSKVSKDVANTLVYLWLYKHLTTNFIHVLKPVSNRAQLKIKEQTNVYSWQADQHVASCQSERYRHKEHMPTN